MKFKLASVIDAPLSIPVMHKVNKPNGTYTRTENMKLSPGEIYDSEGDEVLEKSIRSLRKRRVVWSEAIEQRFKNEGVDYEIITCKSCGGRAAKKIAFHAIQEVSNVKA